MPVIKIQFPGNKKSLLKKMFTSFYGTIKTDLKDLKLSLFYMG